MSTTSVTPAAAPAAPAAPSTPAPAAPATTAPSTPSAPPPSQGQELSTQERLSQGWDKAKQSVAVEEESPEADAVEAPPVEEVVPGAAEEAPAEEAGEVTEPTGEAAEEEQPELYLEDGEALTPQSLAKEIRNSPEVEKFFNERPEIKQAIFAAVRRDTETRELRQIIPDVETAKMVSGAAASWQTIDNHFLSATTPEGVQNFLKHWVNEAVVLDEKGQPKVGQDGKYELHPSLPFIFNHIHENKLSVLREQAQKQGNERLMAALDVLREETSPNQSPALEDFPEELRSQAEQIQKERSALEAQKNEANRRTLESQKVAHEQSIDRAESAAAKSVQGQLKPLFAKASLSEFEQEAALKKIGEELDARLEANRLYQAQRDSLEAEPPSEDREKRLTKLMLRYTNELLGPVASDVIRKAKGGALDRQTTKQNQVETQRRASSAEPRAVSVATPGQTQPQTLSQLQSSIREEYRKQHGGEEPESSFVISEGWKRFQAQQVGRRKT